MKKLLLRFLLCFSLIASYLYAAEEPEQVFAIQLHSFWGGEKNLYRYNMRERTSSDTWAQGKEYVGKVKFPKDGVNTSLTRGYDHEPEKIKFTSPHTLLKFGENPLVFQYEPALFLDKIHDLSPTYKPSVDGQYAYNHLCLTLYVVFKNSGNIQVTESPLYAKWVGDGLTLDVDGNLSEVRKVVFYTKTQKTDADRLAYFCCKGLNSKVKADSTIFPIGCLNCKCNSVCKKFFECKESCLDTHDNCQHTEPNALYHIFKDAAGLFEPLLPQNENDVLNVGIRFFSYYQACSDCVSLLSKDTNKKIKLKGKDFNLNIMFYFHRVYREWPVMLIEEVIEVKSTAKSGKTAAPSKKEKIYNLENSLMRPFLKGDTLTLEKDSDYLLGKFLGYIKLPESLDLSQERSILFVDYHKDDSKIIGNHRFRIYYY